MSTPCVLRCTFALAVCFAAMTTPRSAMADTAGGWPACTNGTGDCFAFHVQTGCEDEACCNKVCNQDPECCSITGQWDSICVGIAEDVCSCAGEGNCFIANGTPSCDNESCCAAVCAGDAYCCDTEWDCICADAAATACGNPSCPGTGSCGEENLTPGCDDELCCNIVCAADPDCCTTWDRICAGEAADLCTTQGEGDCFAANGTPGCTDASCAAQVCATRPGCCQTEWDFTCAAMALELCGNPGCPASGLCDGDHLTPGCDDETCCNSVCAQDPECCTGPWDQLCVNMALDVCPRCPGDGTCDLPNNTPGCEHAGCCNNVCGIDPYCCDVVWDSVCAEAARVVCSDPACPSEGGCDEAPHPPGCDDAECCNIVCLADPDCCSITVGWDSLCVLDAISLCKDRNDEPETAIPVLDRHPLPGSTRRATPDALAPVCGAPDTSPGVWYQLIGTGGEVTVDTCSAETDFDTQLSVFTGDCPRGLTCVAHNDNSCGSQSSVTFPSEAGKRYMVLVQGTNDATGDFELTIWCPADFDSDHDTDLADAAAVMRCYTGDPAAGVDPDCACGNLVGESGVDETDWRVFADIMTGPLPQ